MRARRLACHVVMCAFACDRVCEQIRKRAREADLRRRIQTGANVSRKVELRSRPNEVETHDGPIVQEQ